MMAMMMVLMVMAKMPISLDRIGMRGNVSFV